MKKAAVLVDAGSYKYTLGKKAGKAVSADFFLTPLRNLIRTKEEELFRIFYYDCPPFSESKLTAISESKVDFQASHNYMRTRKIQDLIATSPDVAFRSGWLKFSGWQLKANVIEELKTKPRKLIDKDFIPEFKQKAVDIKIGLDIAWLSSNKTVDALILVSEDTDLIPALKYARKEGLRVVHATAKRKGHPLFRTHSDEVRKITPI